MASSIICKLKYGDEMRRFTEKTSHISYISISKRVDEMLGLMNTKYKLQYKDDEGDTITMTTDEEMTDAVTLALSSNPTVLRLIVKLDAKEPAKPAVAEKAPPSASEVDNLAGFIKGIVEHLPVEALPSPPKAFLTGDYGEHEIHPGVTCDRSGMSPIVGPRYHLKGSNYDLCESEFCKLDATEQAKFVKVEASYRMGPCGKGGKGGKASWFPGMHPCGMGMGGYGGWCKERNKLDQTQTVALQSMLQSEGFSFGPVDGLFGHRTKKALQAFLTSKGYELGPIDGCLGRRSTRALQTWTRDQGADPGPLDGWWGGRTTRAVLHTLNDKVPVSEAAKDEPVAEEAVNDAMAAAFAMGGGGVPWKPKCWGKGMGNGWRCSNRGIEQEKRQDGAKLAARFVSDVSIFDGTQMAPGTKFTKIWRIKNVGELPWPAGTKMLFVGGDRMGADFAVPVGGSTKIVQPGEETDVPVDMSAPSELGRYLGYWRLVGPLGRRRFGQRVWCHIQVVDPTGSEQPYNQSTIEEEISHLMARTSASVEDEDEDEDANAVAPTAEALATSDHNATALSSSISSASSSSSQIKLPKKSDPTIEAKEVATIEPQKVEGPQVQVPIVEPKFEAPSQPKEVKVAAAPLTESTASVESKEAAATAVSACAAAVSSSKAVSMTHVPPNDKTDVATELLTMGFEVSDINLVIEKHAGMTPPSGLLVECTRDLVKISEWSSMFSDLDEMGFGDCELNKRLMLKNDGSVKRTVKDLVADAELYPTV